MLRLLYNRLLDVRGWFSSRNATVGGLFSPRFISARTKLLRNNGRNVLYYGIPLKLIGYGILTLMMDSGSGTNGSPWSPSNWEPGFQTGSATFDIQSNHLRVTASSVSFSTNRVLETLLAGRGGAFDLQFDYIVDSTVGAHGAFISLNGSPGDSSRWELTHYFHTGGIDTARVLSSTYTWPGGGSMPVTASDVVHNHVIRNPASGRLDWYMWLNSGSEPGTPTASLVDTNISADRIEFGIYDPSGTYTIQYSNIVISSS